MKAAGPVDIQNIAYSVHVNCNMQFLQQKAAFLNQALGSRSYYSVNTGKHSTLKKLAELAISNIQDLFKEREEPEGQIGSSAAK